MLIKAGYPSFHKINYLFFFYLLIKLAEVQADFLSAEACVTGSLVDWVDFSVQVQMFVEVVILELRPPAEILVVKARLV